MEPYENSSNSGNNPKESYPKEAETEEEKPVINMSDFSAVDMNEKLNLLMVVINKINTNFHHKFEELYAQIFDGKEALATRITACEQQIQNQLDVLNDEHEGILPRLRDVEQITSDLQSRIETLELQKVKTSDDIVALRGYAQVQEKKINTIEDKVVDLTARNMQNNILIQGITGDTGDHTEDCKVKVLTFLQNIMKIDTISVEDVFIAHRIGRKNGIKPRTMVVKCSNNLRKVVFAHTKNLKDTANELGDL